MLNYFCSYFGLKILIYSAKIENYFSEGIPGIIYIVYRPPKWSKLPLTYSRIVIKFKANTKISKNIFSKNQRVGKICPLGKIELKDRDFISFRPKESKS